MALCITITYISDDVLYYSHHTKLNVTDPCRYHGNSCNFLESMSPDGPGLDTIGIWFLVCNNVVKFQETDILQKWLLG